MNGVSFTLSLPFTSAGAGNQISTGVTLVYHGNKVSELAKALIRAMGRPKTAFTFQLFFQTILMMFIPFHLKDLEKE